HIDITVFRRQRRCLTHRREVGKNDHLLLGALSRERKDIGILDAEDLLGAMAQCGHRSPQMNEPRIKLEQGVRSVLLLCKADAIPISGIAGAPPGTCVLIPEGGPWSIERASPAIGEPYRNIVAIAAVDLLPSTHPQLLAIVDAGNPLDGQ